MRITLWPPPPICCSALPALTACFLLPLPRKEPNQSALLLSCCCISPSIQSWSAVETNSLNPIKKTCRVTINLICLLSGLHPSQIQVSTPTCIVRSLSCPCSIVLPTNRVSSPAFPFPTTYHTNHLPPYLLSQQTPLHSLSPLLANQPERPSRVKQHRNHSCRIESRVLYTDADVVASVLTTPLIGCRSTSNNRPFRIFESDQVALT